MSNAADRSNIETWQSYVVKISVDVAAITTAQYNELCEHLGSEADKIVGPDVDVMVSGSVETFRCYEDGSDVEPPLWSDVAPAADVPRASSPDRVILADARCPTGPSSTYEEAVRITGSQRSRW